jgi:DNA repair protein RadC
MKTENDKQVFWNHPGGKLERKGAKFLTDAELLSILIGTGIKGKSALDIAKEILNRFNSIRGLANQPFEKLMEIKGMGKKKVIKLAASLELARRIVNMVYEDLYER